MTSFKWEKFFDVGTHLIKYSTQEEYVRSAVGRFYYACFNLIKLYYEDTYKISIPKQNSHATLINYLKNSENPKENDLGKYLHDLRRYRNFADYNNYFKINNIKLSKKKSEIIIKTLQNLKTNKNTPKS